MAIQRVPFPTIDWARGAHPLEKKKTPDRRGIGLVEFAPGFVDPNVCVRGHVLYVVDGALDLEVEGGVVSVRAGECAVIDAGTPHRAKNTSNAPVVVFLVSDAVLPE